MTMDFSQLHTYTPPQCAPDNTGYTYSLSSSYSTAALEFEKEHQIAPVYESPRMSRRSLRLQTSAGHYDNESSADNSQNHSSTYTSTRRETRTQRSRKQQSSSLSLSLSQAAATPRKTLCFSAVSTPITNSSSFQESSAASEASQLTSALDQSQLRHRTTTTTTTSTTSTTTSVDGYWGQSSSFSSSGVNGDASVSKSHSSRANGYICKDCSLHSQKTDSYITQSSSSLLLSSSQAAETSTDGLSSSSSPFTSIYTRDRSRRSKSGVLVSISNTCLRYSKQALGPVVSLVSLLFNSVVWLGSRAKSPPGKGTQQEPLCGLHPLPIIPSFSSPALSRSAQKEILSDLDENMTSGDLCS